MTCVRYTIDVPVGGCPDLTLAILDLIEPGASRHTLGYEPVVHGTLVTHSRLRVRISRAVLRETDYDEATDCPICPMVATDRDDALAEVAALNDQLTRANLILGRIAVNGPTKPNLFAAVAYTNLLGEADPEAGEQLVGCDECRDGCDVYECCVTSGVGRVTSWDDLCERHRDHQGFHDCHPGCCVACKGTGFVSPATETT